MGSPKRTERIFFGVMAAVVLVTVFLGFARTYYLSAWMAAPPTLKPATPLVHLHGILFSAWVLLLAVQTSLVAAGCTAVHRKLGMAGAGVAALMVIVGLTTAVHGAVRASGPAGIDPRRFLAIPMFDMIVFAVIAGAGLWKRRDPAAHKRLMLAATVGIMSAAIARWPFAIMKTGPIAFFAINDLMLLPMFVFDLATRRRVHPATLWSAVLIVLSQPLRLAVASTDVWVRVAEWLMGLVR